MESVGRSSGRRELCLNCSNWFHIICADVTRAQLEGEVKDGRWRCKVCKERIQLEERYRRGMQEEEEKRAGGNKLTSVKKKLTILQWNVDGISNRKLELNEVLSRYEADVAIIQGAKLSLLQETPHFQGFTTIRKDRELVRKDTIRRGGLLTLVRNEIPFTKHKDWGGLCMEGIKIKISVSNEESIAITNIYRPSVRNNEEDGRRQDELSKWLRVEPKSVIAGDFNLHSEV